MTIFDEVSAERLSQDTKWGLQNHPSVDPILMSRPGGCTIERMAEELEMPTANRAKWTTDTKFKRGDGSWADVLMEEFAEAVEAAVLGNTAELRKELVQVAAVAVAWIDCVDRGEADNYERGWNTYNKTS